MAKKPFRHALVKHHLPGMRSAVLGVVLAILIIIAATSCPVKGIELGVCSAGFILLAVLAILFIPKQVRHLWHTIEHSDMLYGITAIGTAVAALVLLPLNAIMRLTAAVAIFVLLMLFKWAMDRTFKSR
ncbi:MAG: hypothetical protein QW761_00660 [Candidatus Aenigmatarchaeota archaeon]